MYGIFTNIYPINDPNVGKSTIHGSYGILRIVLLAMAIYTMMVNPHSQFHGKP